VIKNANNCTSTSAATIITVNANPTASFTVSGPTTFCQGDSALLTANSGTGLTYQWRLNSVNITGAINQTHYAKLSGSYTVAVTNTSNCTTVSLAQVITVNSLPCCDKYRLCRSIRVP